MARWRRIRYSKPGNPSPEELPPPSPPDLETSKKNAVGSGHVNKESVPGELTVRPQSTKIQENPPSKETVPGAKEPGSNLRAICDKLVVLTLAILLFKGFVAEGYRIPTASMAPGLWGEHYFLKCPSCGYTFATGHTPGKERKSAFCPSCSLTDIDLQDQIVQSGDQLLVDKHEMFVEPLRRWEPIVFASPWDRGQAHIKRIVGLPGERIELRKGEIYADGEIQRKSLNEVRALRILIHDHDYRPNADESDWAPRWTCDDTWTPLGGSYRSSAENTEGWSWLVYRHWVRSGGIPKTIPCKKLPDSVSTKELLRDGIAFEPEEEILTAARAIPDSIRDYWMRQSDDQDFLGSIALLYHESHLQPVTDTYAYNRREAGQGGGAFVVDFSLELDLTILSNSGQAAFEITDGVELYSLIIDPKEKRIQLESPSDHAPLRTIPFPHSFLGTPQHLELSLVDGRVLLALNGQDAISPWDGAKEQLPPLGVISPVRIGTIGCEILVEHLKLYRDIHYIERGLKVCELGEEEYYVLGDNSPISVDSRDGYVVPYHTFIGRPLFVHFPSRTTTWKLGNWSGRSRWPDFSRMRTVR